MTEITMPKLSDTMTEGVFGTWRKSVGERVAKGDIIAEVETDKATMELEAFADGVLVEQRVGPGQTVAVGAVIGVIGKPEEAAGPPAAAPDAAPSIQAQKNAGTWTDAGPAGVSAEPEHLQTPVPGPEAEAGPEPPPAAPQQVQEQPPPAREQHGGEKSAPVVRRRAQELGIEIDTVPGSGPGGRVLMEDVERFAAARPAGEVSAPEAESASQPAAQPAPAAERPGGEPHPLNRMRAAIARIVSESWRTIPHYSVVMDIRMERAEQVRRELKAGGVQVSLNDMIIKASAMALGKVPVVNASLVEGTIVFRQEVNIGIMVRVRDGLLAPVVKSCQSLSLREIAGRSSDLIKRARSGSISENEIHDGTFSISNLGMYGVNQFSAVILPPQVAILAVGTVNEAVLVRKGQAVVERVMKVTLSADHRVVDGADAAEFLKELKRILENPVQLLL